MSLHGQPCPAARVPARGAVDLGDARIGLLAEGAGDVVVLIPGGGLDASYLDGLGRRLAREGFRAVSLNPR